MVTKKYDPFYSWTEKIKKQKCLLIAHDLKRFTDDVWCVRFNELYDVRCQLAAHLKTKKSPIGIQYIICNAPLDI